jgi:hypothetical protein
MIEDDDLGLAKTGGDCGVGEHTGLNSALGVTPKTEYFIKEAATGRYVRNSSHKDCARERRRRQKDIH